jgi:hypothetical protein
MFVPYRKHTYGHPRPVRGIALLLFADDVRTSQETPNASTACYGDSFTFLYVDDVRTSQDTHLWAYTSCYGDSFNYLYVDDVRTSQDTHL